jgi:hypothetical protein
MLIGAHAIIYSTNAEADRAFLRDMLGLPHVDAGGGWLIFGLPPAEIAVHPSEGEATHELYFMCADVEAFIASMTRLGIECDPVSDQRWGRITYLSLPGGSRIGVYQPRHSRPPKKATRSAARGARRPAPGRRRGAKPSKSGRKARRR